MKKKSTLMSVLLFYVGIILVILASSIAFFNREVIIDQVGVLNTIKTRGEKIVNIKLSFIGDSLVGSYLGQNYRGNFRDLLENNDYSFSYKNVSDIFKKDDYTIANGENVFTDKVLEPSIKNHNPAYWYYAPTRFTNVYNESSIEVVSIMNNHTYDYGGIGYSDTKDAIRNAGLILGAEDPVILEKSGIRIGLLCINLFSRFQYENCVNDIKKIKDEVDYVIVYFHGGVEYLFYPTNEIIEYSHGFIDNGADLVIGAHPHVLEPREIYNDKTIIYSLGSFLFGGAGLVNRTIIYQVNLEYNLDRKSMNFKDNIIPCYLYTNKPGYESMIPSVITDISEKQKVLDFMNQLTDSPI